VVNNAAVAAECAVAWALASRPASPLRGALS